MCRSLLVAARSEIITASGGVAGALCITAYSPTTTVPVIPECKAQTKGYMPGSSKRTEKDWPGPMSPESKSPPSPSAPAFTV